jgi:hypothetical protein
MIIGESIPTKSREMMAHLKATSSKTLVPRISILV